MRVQQLGGDGGIVCPAAYHQLGRRFGERWVGILPEQVFLDLDHLFTPGGGPFLLGVQLAVGMVEVLQVIIGQHPQHFDRAQVPLRLGF